MRPFVFCLLVACLCWPTFAGAQSCGPGGCGTSMGWYSQPTYSYSYPAAVTSPTYGTYSGSSSYSVADDGSIIAPDGGRVTRVGGVEVVAKSYAMSLSKGSEPSKSASSQQCQCDCGPTLAIMKAQLDRIEDKLAYREPQSAKPTADAAVARLEQIRSRQVNESLAVR